MGREVLENMNDLQFHLARVYYFIHWISDWNQRFNSIRWKNAAQARNLINQGMAIAANQPTAERLSPIIKALVDLLPPDEIDILGDAGVGLE